MKTLIINDDNLARLHEFFSHGKCCFPPAFYSVEESKSCEKLLEYINIKAYHETIFSPPKLVSNPRIAKAIFDHPNPQYGANIFGRWRGKSIIPGHYSPENIQLYQKFMEYAISNHIGKMETYFGIADFIWDMEPEHFTWLFQKLAPHNMMPKIMELLMRRFSHPESSRRIKSYYVPSNFLQPHYIDSNLNLSIEEWEVRILMLHLAIGLIEDYNLTLRDIIPSELHFRLKFLEMNHDQLISKLVRTAYKRKDYAFWTVLTGLVLECYHKEKIKCNRKSEWLEWIIGVAIPNFLPPVSAQVLIETLALNYCIGPCYGSMSTPQEEEEAQGQQPTLGIFRKLLKNIPKVYLPPRFTDFSIRKSRWIYEEGPFVTGSSDLIDITPEIHSSQLQQQEKLLMERGLVTLGVLVRITGQIESRRLADIIIERAIESLKSTTTPQSTISSLSTIMLSWPHLINESRQMDLGKFFSQTSPQTCWKEWTQALGEMGPMTIKLLQGIQIPAFFSPFELRQMIDCSQE